MNTLWIICPATALLWLVYAVDYGPLFATMAVAWTLVCATVGGLVTIYLLNVLLRR